MKHPMFDLLADLLPNRVCYIISLRVVIFASRMDLMGWIPPTWFNKLHLHVWLFHISDGPNAIWGVSRIS